MREPIRICIINAVALGALLGPNKDGLVHAGVLVFIGALGMALLSKKLFSLSLRTLRAIST